jgi:hypothetical protein
MKATIADMKTLSHRLTTEEGGVHKMVYHTTIPYGGDGFRRLRNMADDLLVMTISGLKCQDDKSPDELLSFADLWPSLGQDGVDGTLIVLSVPISDEGRRSMREELEDW